MIIVLVVVAIILLLVRYFPALCATAPGLVTITGIIVAALLALKKYHAEQRANRLQKIYFENTFIGQAESIEAVMSQITNNVLLVENLFILMTNKSAQAELNIEITKHDLNSMIQDTLNHINVAIDTTDFKKETISILLKDAGIKKTYLTTWIKKSQDDAYRFSAFLKSLLVLLSADTIRLDKSNVVKYQEQLRILKELVQHNYYLIKRHYILFSLFSEFILFLFFSHDSYADIDDLYNALKNEELKQIMDLINECYIDLIDADFKKVDIGAITKGQAIKLKNRIKCSGRKIAQL
jgi:hypothetical protein